MGLQFEVGILAGCNNVTVTLQARENERLENKKISMNLVNSETEVEI